MRLPKIAVACAALLAATPSVAWAAKPAPVFTPGSAGAGDPYFPADGNGGYDVAHYGLDLKYDPATDVLDGVATITAAATQNLSAFNLDLVGLTVSGVTVDGKPAAFSRSGQELTITPSAGIVDRAKFVAVVTYSGVPQTVDEPALGTAGFFHTDDGALIQGEPHVAAMWFPVNDHPSDAAAYSFEVTVPAGTEAVANGVLTGQQTDNGWTTWAWEAIEPMASYLAAVVIGEFDITSYTDHGLYYLDAIDPAMSIPPVQIESGAAVLASAPSYNSYQRLSRIIDVPADGAQLSFRVSLGADDHWDWFFVEAHHPGSDDWTTLPEASGATTSDAPNGCHDELQVHPFLTHYLSDSCEPGGTSGSWFAGTGFDHAWRTWTFDLSMYAGEQVEVTLAFVSDAFAQPDGMYIDDIAVSTGAGSTSFEDDGDVLDGWVATGGVGDPDSAEIADTWTVVGAEALPTPSAPRAAETQAREPEIVDFLSGIFGKYPFESVGSVIDNANLGFAMENQGRPVFSSRYFSYPDEDMSWVLVHELSHQWYGDSVRLARWSDIWLNEGFATYAEWLWTEHEGGQTPDDMWSDWMSTPADDPFWSVPPGAPGADHLFDYAIYYRGALTLQALRYRVGDQAFFKILRKWAHDYAGQAVVTDQFVALAEKVSRQQLDDLFEAWLYTPAKPAM